MSFRVSTAGFEGPFDLLLRLVLMDKVDIGSLSVSNITTQYLAEMERLQELELEVASDFVLVASTLLEIKSAALLPREDVAHITGDEDLDADLDPSELRELLIQRLTTYRAYKNAAGFMRARALATSREHPRTAGPDPDLLHVMPDYLEGFTLPLIAQICARLLGQREKVLLESEHVARKRIALETRVEQVERVVFEREHLTFDELLDDDPSVQNRVVSLLALLELHKRNALYLSQQKLFGTIEIGRIDAASGAGANVLLERAGSQGVDVQAGHSGTAGPSTEGK